MFRSAESGATHFAVAPAENSTDGVVGRTLDLLLTTPLRICGEVDLRVKQNLLSRMKGLKEIRKIYSHAQSLAQCNGWLGQNLPKAERIPVGSNAEAARRASKEKGAAAIAGDGRRGAVQAERPGAPASRTIRTTRPGSSCSARSIPRRPAGTAPRW